MTNQSNEPKKKIMHVYADPKCPACHGSGTVNDRVPTPFGVGNCDMPSDCECVTRDVAPEWMELIDKDEVELRVHPSDDDPGKYCTCGSGLYPDDQYDGRGIYLCRTCEQCHDEKMSGYRPEIVNRYYDENDVDEQIEPDY